MHKDPRIDAPAYDASKIPHNPRMKTDRNADIYERWRQGAKYKELATEYGIGMMCVQKICSRTLLQLQAGGAQ